MSLFHRKVEDNRIWTSSQDGVFSDASLFSVIGGISLSSNPNNSLWKMKAPPRVLALSWLALRERILNINNLCRRNRNLVNTCPMWFPDEGPITSFKVVKLLMFFGIQLLAGLGVVSFSPNPFGVSLKHEN